MGDAASSTSALLAEIRVIDADTHIVEPYDLWTSRVSTAKWGDKVPHVAWDDKRHCDVWVVGGKAIVPAGMPAQAGYHDSPPHFPPRLDDARPATWRVEDRLAAMDEYGIYAQVLYPNVAGFGGGNHFCDPEHSELNELLIQAYNDFLSDYGSAAPDRLIPMMGVPFWDVDLCIAEMERCRGNGHRGVIFSQRPDSYGQPMLADPHWDRLWAAAQEMGLSINFHIGGGGIDWTPMVPESLGVDANAAILPVPAFLDNARTIASLIFGGVCHRFPDLNFVSVESGVGWLSYLTEMLDWQWKEYRVTREHPEYDLLPSEYFRRQIYGCFWFEHGPSLSAAIETLGADNILYETDFPHPTSMSPGPASSALPAKQFITENLGHLPDDVLRKLLHDNAARVYSLP